MSKRPTKYARKRPVIVHYHLFKNAGTSVDRILRENFPDAWAEIEGKGNKKLDPDALLTFIRNNPHLKAVSSHTAVVNIPKTDDIEILPIFFIRHPVDRIRSAYDFECNQDAQTPGAIQAKKGSFGDYMDWRLSSPAPWQIMNFHMIRLKDFFGFMPDGTAWRARWRAWRALVRLPVVGLVEEFDVSMQRFEALIQPHFPEFKVFEVFENTTADRTKKLEENLSAFAERIGETAFEKLVHINKVDFFLYQRVKRRFNVDF